jgi:hypothetical protein
MGKLVTNNNNNEKRINTLHLDYRRNFFSEIEMSMWSKIELNVYSLPIADNFTMANLKSFRKGIRQSKLNINEQHMSDGATIYVDKSERKGDKRE